MTHGPLTRSEQSITASHPTSGKQEILSFINWNARRDEGGLRNVSYNTIDIKNRWKMVECFCKWTDWVTGSFESNKERCKMPRVTVAAVTAAH